MYQLHLVGKSKLLIGLSVAAMASGCTGLGQIVKTEQQIPVTVSNDGKKVAESGAVILWPPYSSAAVIDKEGNRCVLTASGSKTIDASSEAAFKLGKALEKIEGLDASSKAKVTEAFTKLSAAGSQSTFLDVALFHLCILDLNGTFKYLDANNKLTGKSEAMMKVYEKALEAAKSIP